MGLKAMDSNDATENEATSENDLAHESYRWLAHELHDGLLQWVVAARMQVEAGLSNLDENSAARTKFMRALSQLEQAQGEGRALIGYLDDQAQGDDDVTSALQKYLDAVQPDATERRQSLRFNPPQPPWPALPKQVAWSILRLLQQATQNAIQHAGPAEITISLGWSTENGPLDVSEPVLRHSQLAASVTDNGLGFDLEQPTEYGHFGLQSIQQRAKMCNAVLSIDSAPNAGTRIHIVVPFEN